MNAIFYFTGTGNSLYIAKKISEKLKNCELIEIKYNQEYKINHDIVGIVFPVHAYGLQPIIKNFLKLNEIKANYKFAIANCAGGPGNTLLDLYNLNKTFNYIDYILMPENYSILKNPISKEQAIKFMENKKENLKKIITNIQNRKNYLNLNKKFIISRLFFKIINKSFIRGLKHSVKFFKVDKTKCTGCSICSKSCPMNNIEMVNNLPLWNKNCIQCFRCINICPEHTISFTPITKNRNQYINPHISPKELISK